MALVDGAHVGALEPVLVARHAVRGVPDHRGELEGGDRSAFLRELRRHRVHLLEVGNQAVDAGEVRVDLRDARIASRSCAASGGGNGNITSHDIGTRFCGILRHQLVQDRGAGARHAEDEERPFDALVLDLAVLLAQLDVAQPGLEQPQQVAARDACGRGS